MKQCRKCQREYADETLFFCLDDGTLLSKVDDPQATLQYPPRELRDTLPYAPDASAWSPPARRPNDKTARGFNPLLIVTIVASMLLILVTGIALWLLVKNLRRNDVVVSSPTPSPLRVSSPAFSPNPTPTPIPARPPTGPLANQLIGKWKWNNEVRTYFADGTGTTWDGEKKCHDFTYSLDGDVLTRTFSSTSQCSTSGKYRISISGNTLTQVSVDTGYSTDWIRQ